MRFARLYLAFALVILASCEEPATKDEATTKNEEKQIETLETLEESQQETEQNDPTNADDDSLTTNNDNLSILPPIVLLDFANDLDNSTSGDEKSKRTIDSNLGYGFGRNNLFTGKYNYYFPAGKSGTTVSIEESISPFLPQTIIESVKPITEKPYPGDASNTYGQNPLQQNSFQSASASQGNRQNVQTVNNRYIAAQPVFGQRTKLYKPSQIDYSAYPGFSSTPKSTVESYTTSRPDYRANAYGVSQNTYATPKPAVQSGSYSGFSQGSQTSQRPYSGFSTPAPPSYVTPTSSSYQTYNPNTANSYSTPRPSFDNPTTSATVNVDSHSYTLGSPLTSFSNLPRFTVENGVRYEHKIVWKYPDGKISQTPPSSYVNAYNEFLTKQKPGVGGSSSSYQNVGSSSGSNYQATGSNANYQNLGSQSSFQNQNYQSQLLRYQNSQGSRYSAESLGNIYSKSPAQFPKDQELNKPKRPSPFVSSASLSSNPNYGIGNRPHEQSYSYQGQFGLKNPTRSGPVSGLSSGYQGLFRDNTKTVKDSYGSTVYEEQRPVAKYAVNSPNPEYTYSTEPSIKSTTPTSSSALFTPSGTLSPEVLSKYSPKAQQYLTKVFASGTSATASGSSSGNYGTTSMPQVNTDYESLLNYNPSISQYIRNPSSIYNAQPTFIRAGNSLIPVIILRVDGAPPIQPKSTPNINLKALLQQYLTQYAGSIGQNPKYNVDSSYGNSQYGQASATAPQSPLYELTQLAQSLTQYSQDPSIANSFAKKFEGNLNRSPYETSNSYVPSRTSYDTIEKSGNSEGLGKYGARTNKPQKVKNVQIIEDPRFTSYKVNS